MKNRCLVFTVVVAGLLAAGCGNHYKPVADEPELTEEQANFEAIWRATQNVLKDYYFKIDHRDRRAGLVSTYPMTGQYLAEIWRKDSVTFDDLAESILQTIRRQAKVRIIGDLQAPLGYSAAVEVERWRSNRPHKQLTSTSQGFSQFSSVGKLAIKDSDVKLGSYDVPLGRDEALENRIASAIEAETSRLLAKR